MFLSDETCMRTVCSSSISGSNFDGVGPMTISLLSRSKNLVSAYKKHFPSTTTTCVCARLKTEETTQPGFGMLLFVTDRGSRPAP